MDLKKILKFSAFASLMAIVLLRLYAIFFTVHLHAWDENYYRRVATMSIEKMNFTGTVKDIILPYNENRENWGRLFNYTSWLTLGAKVLPRLQLDNAFHFINFLLFIVQGVLVYAFCFYAAKDHLFSAVFTFLYLSCPISFGVNRTLLTENAVMTSAIVYCAFPLWLVTNKKEGILQDTFIGGIVAFLLGIFSLPREYFVFNVFLVVFGTILSLAFQKRYWALMAFTIIILPYMFRLQPAIEIMSTQTNRFFSPAYFNPLHQWTYHAVLYASGPSLTLLLVFILATGIYYIITTVMSTNIINWIKREKASILFLCTCALTMFYITGIVVSTNRSMRIAPLPIVEITMMSVFTVYIVPRFKQILSSRRFQQASLILILTSWALMYYQLFIAFEGGKSYGFHAFNMEYYNYPFDIPSLRGPDDNHECGLEGDPCPYLIGKSQ